MIEIQVPQTYYEELGQYDNFETQYMLVAKTLGNGTQAKVYMSNKQTAIKIFENEDNRYFQKELAALNALKGHPNVISILQEENHALLRENSDEEKVVSFLALEYISGKNLQTKLKKGGRLPQREVWHLFGQLMTAVKAIHGGQHTFENCGYVGRAHRDLKPANIMIKEDNQLKVIDFGLSAEIVDEDDGNQLHLKGKVGTQSYMAPEVLAWEEGMTYAGDKSDLFSCGVILYNMVTAQMPFKRATSNDQHYQMIYRGKWDEFWAQAPQLFSERLKTTIENLLRPTPAQRKGDWSMQAKEPT